jgi:hypothetical protein
MYLVICSCNNADKKESPAEQTPDALQENKTSYEIISKGRKGNLLEELYTELAEKDEKLKKLENDISVLGSSKDDSLQQTNSFINKNGNYYDLADEYADRISDSVFKYKIKRMIEEGMNTYQSSIAGHRKLITLIDTNNSSIGDLHVALKIVKTLPVITRYQQTNLPPVKPLQNYEKEQNKMISRIDSMLKK